MNTASATIAQLAADYNMQAHEVRALLDLGDAHDDQTPISSFDEWSEAEARAILAGAL